MSPGEGVDRREEREEKKKIKKKNIPGKPQLAACVLQVKDLEYVG